jgi:TolA-binding protein
MKLPIIILFLLSFIIYGSALSQASHKKEASSKRETQTEMDEATNDIIKQIADLEKQLKSATDPDEIKELKDEIAMLQKQLKMMQGLNKNLANISDKTFQQATQQEEIVPKKDVTRISSLPKKVLTEAELSLFIKNVHAGVEKIIPVAERTEALKIYNETKATYKRTAIVANAATGCWMLGHWEKALLIMGKACMDSIADADNLNNYAAFLIMTGGEQAAIPILQYLNSKYPDNSTIINNLGQAWFGLGEMDNAKKYLDSATMLYPNHSMANASLSNISLSQGDKEQSISFLKASLKETYDPEKEAALTKLGYNIKFADMPPLNYPMKEDPFGLIPLINSWGPDKIQSNIADGGTAFALQRYLNGINDFKGQLTDENQDLSKKLEERGKKISMDSAYRQEFLEPHNCPAYLLAGRSLQLYCFELQGNCFKKNTTSPSLMTALWLPFPEPYQDLDKLLSVNQILKDCQQLWFREVLQPVEVLGRQMTGNIEDCKDYDAKMDAYLAKRKTIYARGVRLIQNEFIRKSKKLTEYIKYNLYAGLDDPPRSMNDLSFYLISNTEFTIAKQALRNREYDGVLSLIKMADNFQTRYQSACADQVIDPDQAGDILAPLKVKEVKCEYIKRIITPVRYEFVLRCNSMTESKDPKLKKRKPDVPKGSAASSKPARNRINMSPMQISGRGGGNGFFNEEDQQLLSNQQGPLTPEDKDLSQFSLEYNKWGNLVGFNFQLNEDGSNLKDPDSIESGVDSRWSWNAIASPKKGYMNKLLMK